MHQVTDFAVSLAGLELLRLFREDGDEFPADNLALLLWIGDPFQFFEKPVRGIHADDAEMQAVAQHFEGLFEFVLPEHPRIHEDICQPGPHRAMHQHGGDRGIHASAEAADGPLVSYLFAYGVGGFFDERSPAPLRLRLANVEEKISQQFGAAFGVIYFGMKLDGINLALGIFHRGDGIFRAPDGTKSLREVRGHDLRGCSRRAAKPECP